MSDSKTFPFRERALQAYQEAEANLDEVEGKLQRFQREEIEAYREPLSVDTRKEVTVLLSWGGPSDGFKIYFDENDEALSGVYFLADWFEYEEFPLPDATLDQVLAIYF